MIAHVSLIPRDGIMAGHVLSRIAKPESDIRLPSSYVPAVIGRTRRARSRAFSIETRSGAWLNPDTDWFADSGAVAARNESGRLSNLAETHG